VSLDALWGDVAANELYERLLAGRTPDERFHELERALLARYMRHATEHPAITFALSALHTTPQTRTIAWVVEQSGLSHRQFIALFRRDVGMEPKRFCRLRRFLGVIHRTQDVKELNWAEVALTCGYYDQSHLVNDFHEFAGVPPTEYMRIRDTSTPIYLPYAPRASRGCKSAEYGYPTLSDLVS